MRTVHIHNLTEHMHWQELRHAINEVVHAPAFWAAVLLIALLALLITIAIMQGFSGTQESPIYYSPLYPFSHPI